MAKSTYRLSDGERISKETRDKRIREAKIRKAMQIDNPMFCESLGRNLLESDIKEGNSKIDYSHTISVRDCCNMGKSELCYATENLVQESRKWHDIYSGAPIEEKIKSKVFLQRLEYIKKHNPESSLIIAYEMLPK